MFLIGLMVCALCGSANAGIDFTAPAGKVWRPVQISGSAGSAKVTFQQIEIGKYHEQPWTYPLEGPLLKASTDRTKKTYTLAELRPYMRANPGAFVRPSGFIFHHTRCGSTLAANMLAKVSTNMVSSEAQVPSSVWGVCKSDHQCIRDVMTLMGPTAGGHTHSYIKFPDSSRVAQVSTIFPDTPWIYLFRNPEDVIISNLKGAYGKKDIVLRAQAAGVQAKKFVAPCLSHGGWGGTRAQKCMGYISAANRKALEAYNAHPTIGLLIEYTNMPDVMLEYVYSIHFGRARDFQRDKHSLQEGGGIYSKAFSQKKQKFVVGDDVEWKHSLLNREIKEAVTQTDLDLYELLKSKQKWVKPGV